jgi:leader peptidase (prepilin peptidase)/N-methyltransferase
MQIKWYENIPLFSYILLNGKCSNCKESIPLSYPVVELITALVSVAVYIKIGLHIDFLFMIILFYLLITLSFIDFIYKAVPDYLLFLVLIAAAFTAEFSFYNALLFAGAFVLLEFFITFYIQNIKAKITGDESLKTQKALGEGDIPIAAVIGGVLGVSLGLSAIFLAALFAMVPALISQIKHKEIETPFIPYLTLGFTVSFIWDENILTGLGKVIG